MTEAVDEFLAEAGKFLHAERARNTVILTVTAALRGSPSGKPLAISPMGAPLFGWWRPADGDAVRGAFMHTPLFPVMLTTMTADAVVALASELAGAGRALSGINAEEPDAEAFAAAWRDHTGSGARVRRRMRLFRLGELTWPAPLPEGEARIAARADRDLLISWFDAFAAEVGEEGSDHASAVDDRLSYGGITVWQVGGAPAAIAAVTRTVAGMVRVGPVYTPPGLRGRGYAGAATATVIGYRPVEDRLVLSFG